MRRACHPAAPAAPRGLATARGLLASLLLLTLLPGWTRAQGVSTSSLARTEQYFFDTFGEELGLLQTDIILALLRSRDGYLWIGTERGLTRFDGVRFVSFHASDTPAFANNLIHCLHEDRAGRLWIGTERGVVLYDGEHFDRPILRDIPVRAITEDAEGCIWIGTFGQGLYSWQKGKLKSYSDELKDISPRIRCLFNDSA